MTPQQSRCLASILALTVNGVSPTIREIQASMGLSSTSRAYALVESLKDDGLISFQRSRKRSIVVLADQPAYARRALSALETPALVQIGEAVAEILARRAA